MSLEWMETTIYREVFIKLKSFLQQLLKSRRGRIRLVIITSLAVILSFVSLLAREFTHGVIVSYYENTEWIGPPKFVTRTRFINLASIKHTFPKRTTYYCVEWEGFLFIRHPGEYEFITASDDGSDIFIDRQMIVDNHGQHGLQENNGIVYLEKGFHAIRIRYMQVTGIAAFRAYWNQVGHNRMELSQAILLPKRPDVSSNLFMTLQPIIHVTVVILWSLILLIATFEIIVWWDKIPLSWRLAIFFVFNAIVINHILSLSGERTTLYYTKFFLTSPIHERADSWGAMYAALTLERDHPETPLYQEVFFNQHTKFQYPPTSLFWIYILPKWTFEGLIHRLNFLSWLSILASIYLLAALYYYAYRKYADARVLSFTEKTSIFLVASGFTLTFYPLMRSFQLGQIQTELYFIFTLALLAWLKEKKALSGVCIGLMCTIKPQLGLLVIWGSIRKEWRFAIAMLVTIVSIGIPSIFLFGWNNHLDYLHVLSYISKHGESYYPNQSVNGFLNRLLFNGPNLMGDVHYFAHYHRWVYVGTISSSLILIMSALFWKHSQYRHARLVDFLIAVLSFTMASPIAWEHHYSILLPMFAVILPLVLRGRSGHWAVMLFVFCFILASNFYVITNRLAATHYNILQSYLLFSAYLFLFQLYHLRQVQHAHRCLPGMNISET